MRKHYPSRKAARAPQAGERGIALIITIIMMSVVLLMAVVFLAVTRRERSSVTVATDQMDAHTVADIGAAAAQTRVISGMFARNDLSAYDLLVSTNFISGTGFVTGMPPSATNVSYNYPNGNPLNADDLRAMLANLRYDPRPPVFITLPTGQQDFRYYLDLNRNGRFDPNGIRPVIGQDGKPIAVGNTTLVANATGDPEWIGVLMFPDQPHSKSNPFIGRYAYIVLPAGKTLDLNYIHNRTKFPNPGPMNSEGYRRNQGVGSWEINLAAFFRELNTNYWGPQDYIYTPALALPSSGRAFDDALAILRHRYTNNIASLKSVSTIYGTTGAAIFGSNFADDYALGPDFFPVLTDPDSQITTRSWPGAENPEGFYDVNQLLNLKTVGPAYNSKAMAAFSAKLDAAGTSPSTYDNTTFYRLLAQMGTESTPANQGKMHLNYDNLDPVTGQASSSRLTNFIAWTPLRFFTNAAERMMQADMGMSITNIKVYPRNGRNDYDGRIHRNLQLAANLYDATTNTGPSYPFYPSVFRPRFRVEGTNIFIAGYTTNNTTISQLSSMVWRDLNDPADRAALQPDDNVYGVPWVIGAKKGYPNFNEFSVQSAVQVTRKIELVKNTANKIIQTNQLYQLGITNRLGMEAWNSYSSDFPRALKIQVLGRFTTILTNENPALPYVLSSTVPFSVSTTVPAFGWRSNAFQMPLAAVPTLNNMIVLPDSSYRFLTRPNFTNTTAYTPADQFRVPQWGLILSNRFVFAITDDADRVVDLATFDALSDTFGITELILGQQTLGGEVSTVGQMWLTNRLGASTDFAVPTTGIINQLRISNGESTISDGEWASYNADPISGADKQKSIDLFRKFLGLSPIYPQISQQVTRVFDPNKRSYQAPFTPTRKAFLFSRWQVNDPLVHYWKDDLGDLSLTNKVFLSAQPAAISPPEMQNIGKVNQRYRPWGGSIYSSGTDARDYSYAYKDPLVYRSDDWNFPTNKFATLGWMGMVHRGTPWQTVYLKSNPDGVSLNDWARWSGHGGTYPTNDWKFLSLFTTAISDNAARGLLSVNQSNQAAWSAVFSGISVISNVVSGRLITKYTAPSNVVVQVDPATPQMRTMVESINRARSSLRNETFPDLGTVLSAKALTVNSPYLNTSDDARKYLINDQMYERIPMQVLSLLKDDDARVAIYVFGQSLKAAPESQVLSGPYRGMVTNYMVTGEKVTKTVVRYERVSGGGNAPLQARAVVESYTDLPPE